MARIVVGSAFDALINNRQRRVTPRILSLNALVSLRLKRAVQFHSDLVAVDTFSDLVFSSLPTGAPLHSTCIGTDNANISIERFSQLVPTKTKFLPNHLSRCLDVVFPKLRYDLKVICDQAAQFSAF